MKTREGLYNMGEFIIPIYVREEQSLYSEFDPSGLSFSSNLTDYLSDYIEDRKLGEKVSIEIQAACEVDMERMRKSFLLFIDKSSRRNKREIVRSQANAVRLLLIGVLFIVIGIFSANRINKVIAAIISTIGSFSVWEASAVWIETLPVLRKKERLLSRFSETEFRLVRRDTL